MSEHQIEPHLFVIFGATGDLTRRKIIPALYHMLKRAGGVERSFILGAARRDWSDEDFKRTAREALSAEGFEGDEMNHWCDHCVGYQSVGDDRDYASLAERIEAVEEEYGLGGNRVFYLALPPGAFPPTITGLGEAGLNEGPGWTRLVIEKPFGHDLESAQSLNKLVHSYFDEHQVYRIDHYLGKQTVQNLLAFRFANALFEPLWNRDRIARIEVLVAEDLGAGGRIGYYNEAGALRDMIQNHLTQLFTLIAMEAPSAFDADAIRQEKIKVLRSVQALRPEDVVLGQYIRGTVGAAEVPGYQEEKDAVEGSNTETYVAVRLRVANWRWQGVPFVLRTGKRLPERRTKITVQFREAPVALFQPYTCATHPNSLVIALQPDEGFDLFFEVKTPDEPFRLETQRFRFRYEEVFGASFPDAYETLLLDTVQGDQTLFVHGEEVEASWRLYASLLERNTSPHPYPAGSWGPDEADRLLAEQN